MGSSGSKQKKKGKTKDQHHLPDHVYDIFSRCLHSLPLPNGAVTEETVQKAASYTEVVEVFEPKTILTKGQRSKGLYFVIKGEAEVLSSNGEAIATLTSGSLFGELSTLFYIPCTATVKIPTKALLLLLRADRLRMCVKDQVVSMSLLDYYISKRYFDTNGIIKKPAVLSTQITKSLLKEIPMFKEWGEAPIDSLIENLTKDQEDPVILVPPKSFVVNEGDPADEVIIVGRGRVEVLKEKELITEIDAVRWPLCLGEEDYALHNNLLNNESLFMSSKSLVSIRSVSPCMAIIIKNAYISEVVEKYKEDCGEDYADRLERWIVHPGIDEESPIRVKYGPQLILPVLLKRLGDTPLLFDAPLGLVYDLAMDCEIKERGYSKVIMGKSVLTRRKSSRLVRNESKYTTKEKPVDPKEHGVSLPVVQENGGEEDKEVFRIPPKGSMTVEEAQVAFEDSDSFLVVLAGAMVLGGNNDWICPQGEMLWVPRKVKHKTKLTAKGDTLTVQLSGASILRACSQYPNTTLYIPSMLR